MPTINTEAVEKSLHLKLTNLELIRRREGEPVVLKVKQIQAILASCEGHDVLAILATGYGKSLIFEAIPIFLQLSQGIVIKTLIMSPLNVIIDQQLTKLGDAACHVVDPVLYSTEDLSDSGDSSEDEYGDLRWNSSTPTTAKAAVVHSERDFQFIVGHPEDFLNNIEKLRNSIWATKVQRIVVDECHTVPAWAKEFRRDFGDIHQLKSVFPSAKLLGLTATASVRMQGDIQRLLCMTSAAVIQTSVDRPNTKYNVTKRDSNFMGTETSYTGVFMPYVHQLKEQGSQFPKTVVYTNLEWCGFGNELGVRHLTTDINSDGVPQIAQYHAPLSAQAKKSVAEKMQEQSGPLRLLMATISYGMGVDTPDIRRVVHAGPPCTLESYMQTTGRAGRDGLPCEAILHYNNEDAGKVTVEPEMKKFLRLASPDCRRKFLCDYFGTEMAFRGEKHACCDLCEKACTCEVCTTTAAAVPLVAEAVNLHSKVVEMAVYEYLTQLFPLLNSLHECVMDTQLTTGLTERLAKDIATNYEHLLTVESLGLMYMHLDKEAVEQIHEAIKACHCDFK